MKNNATVWFIAGFIVVAVAGVIIAGAMSGGSSTPTTDPNFVATAVPALTATDWKTGSPDSKVSLIEYGDFECPACAAYEPLWNQLIKDYGDRVTFAFRNFPLYTIHPDAGISAQAAQAAGLQGKFWEMYRKLYESQNEWVSTPSNQVVSKFFDGYASSLGLDVNKFNSDVASNATLAKIKADVDTANAAQVDHTPTFFLNLKQIPNPTSYDQFKTALDQALAAATSTPAGK